MRNHIVFAMIDCTDKNRLLFFVMVKFVFFINFESGIWMDGYNYQNITTITTILVLCKCNRQHRWLDIAITTMNAGLAQVNQICMLVGASLIDMAAG